MNFKNDLAQNKHVTERYMQYDSIYYKALKQTHLTRYCVVKTYMMKTNKKQRNDFHKIQDGDYFRK